MADTTRRAFLRSYLAPAAGGAGAGLLLPLVGQGALALAPEAVAQIPVVPAAMPFSVEALLLRQIRRQLHACHLSQHERGYEVAGGEYRSLMVNHYRPVERRMIERPVRCWPDVVEIAEACWMNLAHQCGAYALDDDARHEGRYGRFHLSSKHDPRTEPFIALVEAVLTMGDGERFSPQLDEGVHSADQRR